VDHVQLPIALIRHGVRNSDFTSLQHEDREFGVLNECPSDATEDALTQSAMPEASDHPQVGLQFRCHLVAAITGKSGVPPHALNSQQI
jgi:hypothetical protein